LQDKDVFANMFAVLFDLACEIFAFILGFQISRNFRNIYAFSCNRENKQVRFQLFSRPEILAFFCSIAEKNWEWEL
jgi:hypothetical protein